MSDNEETMSEMDNDDDDDDYYYDYDDNDDEVNDEEVDDEEINDKEVDDKVDDKEVDDVIDITDEVDKEKADDDNNNNKRNKNQLEGSTSKSSDVWDYVDREERKCPYCAKIFGKKTGTSSIKTHLISHGVEFKKKQTTLDSFIQ